LMTWFSAWDDFKCVSIHESGSAFSKSIQFCKNHLTIINHGCTLSVHAKEYAFNMIVLYSIKLVTHEQNGSKNSPNLSCWIILYLISSKISELCHIFNNLPIFITLYCILMG
jgi:hypothetical protein